MDFFAVHSDSLLHRCQLPLQYLNHILAEGHIDSMENGLIFKISSLDADNSPVFLGMTEFGDDLVVLPVGYLPDSSHVAVEVLTDNKVFADKMIIQAENDGFAHEMSLPGRDAESILVDYIQREVPVINEGAVFEIHGETGIHRLHVISLWKETQPVKFTYAINHEISVEFIPSVQAEQDELERERLKCMIPEPEPEIAPTPIVSAPMLGGSVIATTREERAAAFRKKIGLDKQIKS